MHSEVFNNVTDKTMQFLFRTKTSKFVFCMGASPYLGSAPGPARGLRRPSDPQPQWISLLEF